MYPKFTPSESFNFFLMIISEVIVKKKNNFVKNSAFALNFSFSRFYYRIFTIEVLVKLFKLL